MELRHLRYFVAAAEEQNVTRAAARLRVSQPPLSRQLRDLEHELGVDLFVRGPKSVRLTDAGRMFLGEARAVIDRAEQARQAVRAVARGRTGELHIGYAPSLTVELLPHALRLFQEKVPGARVSLHDLSTEEILDGLKERRLGVGLVVHPGPRALSGLLFDPLRRYAVRVAAHPSHPCARHRSVPLRSLLKERLLGYTRDDYPEYHDFLKILFAPLGGPPRFAEEHDSATSLVAAIEAGRGLALVPESFSCFAGVRLTLVPITPSPNPIIVGVCQRKEPPSDLLNDFLDAVKTPAAARVPSSKV